MHQHHTSIHHAPDAAHLAAATLANEDRVSRAGKWRDSFTCVTVNIIQRAAEKQAFDNITMMAAACVIDYGYEMITKALKHRRGATH